MREDSRVEELHRCIWCNKCKKHHARREDQGLRIGDRRVAAEMIRIPKRNLAIMQSIAKETEHRVKMIFRIPRHDRPSEEPRGQRETVKEDESKNRKPEGAPRPSLSRIRILRFEGTTRHNSRPGRGAGYLAPRRARRRFGFARPCPPPFLRKPRD